MFLFHADLAQGDFGKNEYKESVSKAFEQWHQGKGSFFDLLHENVEWKISGSGIFSGSYNGKQEFLEKAVIPINDQLKTAIKPQLIDKSADGNTVWLH